MEKRLYRSQENKVFAGIFSGLGEYLDIDPVMLRVIWLAVTIFTGFIPGIIVYTLALFVIPNRPQTRFMVPAQGETGRHSQASKESSK